MLGIDVSKNTLDVSLSSCNKVRARSFPNSSDGWRHLLDWLINQKVRRVHACLESTGRYSLGVACVLYEIGHIGLIPLTQVPLYVVSERSASVRGIARKPGHGAGPFARRVPEGIRRRGELRHVPVQVSLAPRLRLSRLRQAPRQRA